MFDSRMNYFRYKFLSLFLLLLIIFSFSCKKHLPKNPYINKKAKLQQLKEEKKITEKQNKAYKEQLKENKKEIEKNTRRFSNKKKQYKYKKQKKIKDGKMKGQF